MNPKSVTVFFPACNDGGTIGSQVITAVQLLSRITDDYEVLVVNDGSHDHTVDVLAELSGRYPQLRVIHHAGNRGYGAALRSGFAAARKEWIFYTDGDAQYDPYDLLRLLAAWDESVDMVTGYKIVRQDPLYRIVLGWLYQHLAGAVFGLHVRDVDCDFRLIRRRALDAVALESDTGVICVEMMKKFQTAGCRVVEVPVPHYCRTYGTSQFFRPRHLWQIAGQLIWLWWKLVVRREPAALSETKLAAAGKP